MLTRKQHELLLFIHERLRESGIHRLITALEERGFIRRLPNRARALEVIKLPDSLSQSPVAQRRFAPSVIEGSLGRAAPLARMPARSDNDDDVSRAIGVPMMGRIAAGVPISAIQHQTSTIACPPDLLGLGDHYALEVKGDSMIDAGIFDGDTVLIKRSDSCNTGDIVVALVDDEEATLKRFRRKGASIALEAANPAYETRIFGPDRVRVQGKVVGLMRRYN